MVSESSGGFGISRWLKINLRMFQWFGNVPRYRGQKKGATRLRFQSDGEPARPRPKWLRKPKRRNGDAHHHCRRRGRSTSANTQPLTYCSVPMTRGRVGSSCESTRHAPRTRTEYAARPRCRRHACRPRWPGGAGWPHSGSRRARRVTPRRPPRRRVCGSVARCGAASSHHQTGGEAAPAPALPPPCRPQQQVAWHHRWSLARFHSLCHCRRPHHHERPQQQHPPRCLRHFLQTRKRQSEARQPAMRRRLWTIPVKGVWTILLCPACDTRPASVDVAWRSAPTPLSPRLPLSGASASAIRVHWSAVQGPKLTCGGVFGYLGS